MRPVLDDQGIDMLLVSIGTKERGLEFVEKTEFPADRLIADPTSACYEALGLKSGIRETFFSYDTPSAIWKDIKSGRINTLRNEVMPAWIESQKKGIWNPPEQKQALQQGGMAVFYGKDMVYLWKDPATGAHADFDTVLDIATKDLGAQ